MNIIIIGCGKVGASLAHVLAGDGHDVVIIDNDRDAFKALKPGFNGITVAGVPIDQDVLKQAGIETADALTAVTPDDNINIMACQVAKEIFKVPRVIARIYNPEREHVFHEFGLDTICPTNLTVDVIRSKVLGEADVYHHTIGGDSFTFKREIIRKIDEGKKLGSLKIREDSMIFGVFHNNRFVFANPGYRLSAGDMLVLANRTH
ncbi:MAG: TrkA family potassium uptake protein [Ruminiclostridium sp.]|nr:TrkA family potassium uptake protein [Ruminiclostridium sp.]